MNRMDGNIPDRLFSKPFAVENTDFIVKIFNGARHEMLIKFAAVLQAYLSTAWSWHKPRPTTTNSNTYPKK